MQRKMLKNLGNVLFRKYLVHIHSDSNSHAAIIVRKDEESFSNGWIVLKHWAGEFEV